jgi:hypothetical protein
VRRQSQLALAWALSQGDHLLPMPSTKLCRYLERKLGAERDVDPEELGEIDVGCPPDGVVFDHNAAAAIKAMNL